jgi:hypothetical protein
MNHLINQMLSELIFFVSEKKEYLSYDCVLFIFKMKAKNLTKRQLLTVDLLARASMKNAASCDT